MKKATSAFALILLACFFAFAAPAAAAEDAATPTAWDFMAEYVGELMEGLFGDDAPAATQQSESTQEDGAEDGGGLPDYGPTPDPVG